MDSPCPPSKILKDVFDEHPEAGAVIRISGGAETICFFRKEFHGTSYSERTQDEGDRATSFFSKCVFREVDAETWVEGLKKTMSSHGKMPIMRPVELSLWFAFKIYAADGSTTMQWHTLLLKSRPILDIRYSVSASSSEYWLGLF